MYVGLDWLIVISIIAVLFLIGLLIYLLKSDFENMCENITSFCCYRMLSLQAWFGWLFCFITKDFFFLYSLITLIITN